MQNSNINLEIKNWTSENKNRKIKYTWFQSEYLGTLGLVLFIENGITVNFVSYSLEDVKIFKRLYARASVHLANSKKANALQSALNELNTPDFKENHLTMAKKCGELLNILLQPSDKR